MSDHSAGESSAESSLDRPTLLEAIEMCKSQVWGGYNTPPCEVEVDEYRRGQRRGAIDCVKMLERMLADAE
jgi:hypothetical protein